MARNKKPVTIKGKNGATITKNVPIQNATSLSNCKNMIDKKTAMNLLGQGEMLVTKILNGYMFDSNNPNKDHTYAVYKDNTTNKIHAVETTHLYKPDDTNIAKLNKGLLCKVKFDRYDTPSGANNYYYNANKNGGDIDINNSAVFVQSIVSKNDSIKIKRFAKNLRKR